MIYRYLLFLLLFVTQTHAEIFETDKLQVIRQRLQELSQEMRPSDIVVAFDIDNTLLKLQTHMGSVQWYLWQSDLIKEGTSPDRVATNIDDLLKFQKVFYQAVPMKLVDPEIIKLLAWMRERGFKYIYHTSRSVDMRSFTERELKLNGLWPVHSPFPGIFDEFTFPGVENQRSVSFQNGIYMSAGQDKGIWLQKLMGRFAKHPKHVVFVDDEKKNIDNLERAFVATGIPTSLYRYSKVDPEVLEFRQSDKAKEIRLGKELHNLLNHLAPEL